MASNRKITSAVIVGAFLLFTCLTLTFAFSHLGYAEEAARPLGPAPETLETTPPAHIAQHRRLGFLFDLANLDGIDTVIVGASVVPEHTLLPQHQPTPKELKTPPPDPIFLTVQDIFSTQPWISVRMARDVPVQEWSKPNVIFLDYAISAQKEMLHGKTVRIASLALQLWKYDTYGPYVAIPVLPATYPFLIPASEAAFNERVDSGVRYLTSYLAGYLAAANSKPGPQPDSKNPFLIRAPFQETLHGPCAPPAKGQTIPVPCSPAEE